MKNKYEPSVFTNEWGAEVSSGGYVQVPNDFVRNLGLLDLSANEAMIVIVIMSYGKQRPISANQIADHLGLSIRTVRTAFRKLDRNRKLIHRNYGVGEANTFTIGGLKRLIVEVAKNRQTYRQKRNRGIGNRQQKPEKELPTNKEAIKNKYKKEVGSYAQYKKERDELAKKKSV